MTGDEVRRTNAIADIEHRTAQLIHDHLGGGEFWKVEGSTPSRENNLGGDLGADSLDIVELVMAAEDEFGCEIPDDEITGRFEDKTVGDFYDVVIKYALA